MKDDEAGAKGDRGIKGWPRTSLIAHVTVPLATAKPGGFPGFSQREKKAALRKCQYYVSNGLGAVRWAVFQRAQEMVPTTCPGAMRVYARVSRWYYDRVRCPVLQRPASFD